MTDRFNLGVNSDSGTVVIAESASLSSAIQSGGMAPSAILMPAGWDAAALTFQASVDGLTYLDVFDAAGELSQAAAADRLILLDTSVWVAMKDFKIRSGTSGVPVNQTAERTLTVFFTDVVAD